jgi:hypothetical protein
VSSLELGSVTIQARLGSARLLYKLDSVRFGYCTSSARARLSSTRLGSFTGLIGVDVVFSLKKKDEKLDTLTYLLFLRTAWNSQNIFIPLKFIANWCNHMN